MSSLSSNSPASPQPNGDASEALSRLQQIDAVCDRFEEAWNGDTAPSLEKYLADSAAADRDALLRELLAIELEYRRDDQGRRMTARQIVALYPALTKDIADEFCRMPTVRSDAAGTGLVPSTDSAGLHIRCPHCQSQVELVEDAPLEDITCRSCGSNFTLVGSEHADESPATPRKKVGRFELLKLLGMGGFGAVWKARDSDLDRCVALKIPRRGQISRTEAELFFREARAAAQLRHPNIVPVHEVGRDGETIFIVSDLIRGEPLSARLKEDSPRFPFRETARILAGIADALEAAHSRGVVHRDLKPSNIMLDDTAEPHLMDFGLAKRQFGEITMTIDGQVLGTPAYMSPEQAAGETKWIDKRTDIYSFGVMLFQMLTGELPFRGSMHSQIRQRLEDDPPNPRKLNDRVPLDLATIALRCLERDPNRRYASAELVGEELRRYLRGEPILARPISRTQRAARWAKRNPTLAAAAVLTAVLAVAGPTAAAVIYLQLQALQASRAANTELVARGVSDSDASTARIQSLRSEREQLLAANPALADLPDDWRATLARQYLDEHYAAAAEKTNALPSESFERAAAQGALARLLRMADRPADAVEHLLDQHTQLTALMRAADDAQRLEVETTLADCCATLAVTLETIDRSEESQPFAAEALSLRQSLARATDASLSSRVNQLYSVDDHLRRQTKRLTGQPIKQGGEAMRLIHQLDAARDKVKSAWGPTPDSAIELAEAIGAYQGTTRVSQGN